MERKVSVVSDLDGNKVVVIHDIQFKGRQAIEWPEVEKYLKQYVGEANAAQGIPEMLVIANEKEYEENRKDKHSRDAKYGWYSYATRFALPVYGDNNDIERYNVFRAIMLIRHAEDNRLYLYDIIKIKKETSTHFRSEDLTQ